MLSLEGKRVAVTGPNSMIGRAVCRKLQLRGAHIRELPHNVYDLLKPHDVANGIYSAEYCIHCAGYNGNISFNSKYPADIYYRTALMGLNVLSTCKSYGIKKVVSPLSSCSYPDTDVLVETQFANGPPNITVEAHGLSKRVLFDYARQLYKQYGYQAVSVVFNTCYGPHDSFEIDKTKVVGGLINKFSTAKKENLESVECWGSGNVRREFIYCDDAAEGIIQALEKYDDPTTPLNIGTGTDNSVKELAETIKDIIGYDGTIIWNTSKPDGQYRKLLQIGRMPKYIDINFTSLQDGLTKTIEWYQNDKRSV